MSQEKSEDNPKSSNKESKGNYRFIFDILFVLLLLAVIVIVFVDMKRITNANNECLGNPISYGIQKWEEANDKDFTCTCVFGVQNSPILLFTDEGFTQQKIDDYSPTPSNFSYTFNLTK